jgi:hypothetical protein
MRPIGHADAKWFERFGIQQFADLFRRNHGKRLSTRPLPCKHVKQRLSRNHSGARVASPAARLSCERHRKTRGVLCGRSRCGWGHPRAEVFVGNART